MMDSIEERTRLALAEAYDSSLEAVFVLRVGGEEGGSAGPTYENPAFRALFPGASEGRAALMIAAASSASGEAVTLAVPGASEVELSVRRATIPGVGLVHHCLVAGAEREHERLLRAVYDISALTALADDMGECYSAIHRVVSTLMDARNFYIAAYDEEEGTIRFDYHVDEFDPPPPPKKLDDGLTSHVIRSGEPYLYRCDREELERERLALVGHPAVDWIGVPLKVGDRVHGAMVIQSYDRDLRYADREKDLLAFVARHIALAIERKRAEEELKSLSLYDELTGLLNRRGFMTLAEQQVRVASRARKDFLVFFFDLDNMKEINDSRGHADGDLALKALSRAMRSSFREADILARFGGDEFVALAAGAGEESEGRIRERFEREAAALFRDGEVPFPLEASVGVACYDCENPKPLEALVSEADGRMYEEKQRRKSGGRGTSR